MHPIVAKDRQTTTLGNLMFTAELPNAGHYNKLSSELCDLLRVPICPIRPIRDGGSSFPPRMQTSVPREQSYKDVTVGSSSSSGDANSSLTTTSSSDQFLATLTQTLSLFKQQTDELREESRQRAERDRIRDEQHQQQQQQQNAFNLHILTLLQQREGGPNLPQLPSDGI